MAKKKKHEEHENLERWLVSYADFMTLLFATFVVLYALSQIDVSSYANLQDSIRQAFAAPSVMEGSESILPNSANSILDPTGAGGPPSPDDSFVPPIMEYISAKYEEKSFKDIKKDIEKMEKSGEIEGVDVTMDDRGLHINLKDSDLFFRSGDAKLKPNTYKTLNKIADLIHKKFARHLIRIEGHTDNVPIKSDRYPSNWELSSARACSVARFFIDQKDMDPTLISAIGYSDTKPLVGNNTEKNRRKNRRVEILVLKNKLAGSEPKGNETIKPSEKTPQEDEEEKMSKGTTSAVDALLDGKSNDAQGVIVIKDDPQTQRAQAVKRLQKMEKEIEDSKVKSVIPAK
jgi:chemotaxis protein MotB